MSDSQPLPRVEAETDGSVIMGDVNVARHTAARVADISPSEEMEMCSSITTFLELGWKKLTTDNIIITCLKYRQWCEEKCTVY